MEEYDIFMEKTRAEGKNEIMPQVGNVYEIKCLDNKSYYWFCSDITFYNKRVSFHGYTNHHYEALDKRRFYPFGKGTDPILVCYSIRNSLSFSKNRFENMDCNFIGTIKPAKFEEWFKLVEYNRYVENTETDNKSFNSTGEHALHFFREGGIYKTPDNAFAMCISANYFNTRNIVAFRGWEIDPKTGYTISGIRKLDLSSASDWIYKGSLDADEYVYYNMLYRNGINMNLDFIINRYKDIDGTLYTEYKEIEK